MRIKKRNAWYFRAQQRMKALHRAAIAKGAKITNNGPNWLLCCHRAKSERKKGNRVIILDVADFDE